MADNATGAELYGGYFTWLQAKGTAATRANTGFPGGSGGGSSTPPETITNIDTDGSICPQNWRLPTSAEISILVSQTYSNNSWTEGSEDANGLKIELKDGSCTMYIPNAGIDDGAGGCYWSNTEYTGSLAYYMIFGSGNTYGELSNVYKLDTYAIRCVRDA